MLEVARRECENQLNLQAVGAFISPVHDAYGKPNLIHSSHRIEMCRLAVQNSDWIEVDDWEISCNSDWSSTKQVLLHFKNNLPNTCKLAFVVGSDVFESMILDHSSWPENDVQWIFDNFIIVIVQRNLPESGYAKNQNQKSVIETFCNEKNFENANFILSSSAPYQNVSSTNVRQLIAENKPADHLVPSSVLDFYKKNILN